LILSSRGRRSRKSPQPLLRVIKRPYMVALAIDTCDVRGSVAVLKDERTLASTVHDVAQDYSSWLLPAVDQALRDASCSMNDITVYAVTSGPGSFTGVRVGLTTVKAWAEVYRKPIVAVSRLEVLARQSVGDEPYVASFIDAQRGQIFAALYQRQSSSLLRIEDEFVSTPQEFVVWVAERIVGAGVAWVSTDPSLTSELNGVPRALQISPVLAPLVGTIGIAQAQRGEFVDTLKLDANYVRRSYVEVFPKK
jgi:tRNA threonylcarbamoyladenosine biosynthesis protein TsaB